MNEGAVIRPLRFLGRAVPFLARHIGILDERRVFRGHDVDNLAF